VDGSLCPIVGRAIRWGESETYVPAAGTVNEVMETRENGHHKFQVETRPDGQIIVRDETVEAELDDGAPPSTNPCSTVPYYTNGRRVNREWEYFTNVFENRPDSMDEESARLGLKSGFDIILTSANDCGLADVMTRTARNVGNTTIDPCGANGLADNIEVLGFGPINADTTAVACTSTSNGVAVTGDVRINSIDFRWVREITASCGVSRHLSSTMAHEIGHLYGLADTYASTNAALTMYGRGRACSTHKATLALGDWRGLDALY
jgi:hypothetical protein